MHPDVMQAIVKDRADRMRSEAAHARRSAESRQDRHGRRRGIRGGRRSGQDRS